MEQLVAMETQPDLSKLVEEVRRSGKPLVITQGSKEQAALIDINLFFAPTAVLSVPKAFLKVGVEPSGGFRAQRTG